jgi:adenine-specific DNA methylase
MIEKDFDITFIADLALREKQIQQNYRPIIAVHKWFARRPGTLFRGLLLSEYASRPLREVFYQPNSFNHVKVADPFMGGGIPVIEANRVGCNVIGYDINPMSYWIVKREIEYVNLASYRQAAENMRQLLEKEIGRLYRTKCLKCGSPNAYVKYFLWIKTKKCTYCGKEIDLFPGYLVAQNRRHPKNVFVCQKCGELSESDDRGHPGQCTECGFPLAVSGPAKRNRCPCPHCKKVNSYPQSKAGPPTHRLFAIEYHCPLCKPNHRGRFFKKPDINDLSMVHEAKSRWKKTTPKFLPDDAIPQGDESSRLHRWGYNKYRELFNSRQLLGLELSCNLIDKVSNKRVQYALATNLSDLLRYQNMVCRYDKMALKSLDIFSVHGFPVGLIQCESNFLGIEGGKKGGAVGSGGWLNIIEKYAKAKAYCYKPFEFIHEGKRKRSISIPGEWIGDLRGDTRQSMDRSIDLFCSDATENELPKDSLDGVFTDPPYFGNVQYAELMDFCFVWLRKLVGKRESAFKIASTRHANELTGNQNMRRGLTDFTEGISSVFRKMSKALKRGSPLVFTYHHNDIAAYYPVAVAILDSGLICSASLPCPAEMGASIHINGTGSSIIDTVFVCRHTGKIPRRWVVENAKDLSSLVHEDFDKLLLGGVRLTQGDIRCIVFGHLTRLAIWHLREQWDKDANTSEKLELVGTWISNFGGVSMVEEYIETGSSGIPRLRNMMIKEPESIYATSDAQISF